MWWKKAWEFWPSWTVDGPYVLYLLWCCLRYRLWPTALIKANWQLDHGDIGIGSKYEIQMTFDQSYFPATVFVAGDLLPQDKVVMIHAMGEEHGYPLICKPDYGFHAKGVIKINTAAAIDRVVTRLTGDYLCQAFVGGQEYGIFWVREGGVGCITGITRKEPPVVVGDGVRDIQALVVAHPRYSSHWQSRLRDQDLTRVPAAGEEVRIGFLGSHTLGSCFLDSSDLVTDALQAAVDRLFADTPGINWVRFDCKAVDDSALQAGEFVVLEVNGVTAMPTHMFDPTYSYRQGMRIYRQHGQLLAKVAREHRQQRMDVLPFLVMMRRIRAAMRATEVQHASLKISRDAQNGSVLS